MIQTIPQSVEQLIQRMREHVRVLLGAVYTLYVVLVTVFKVPAQIMSFQAARWWGLGVVALLLTLSALGVLRNHTVNLLLNCLIVPCLWLCVGSALQHGVSPFLSLLWSTLLCIFFYVMLGSVGGSLLSLTLGLGIAALVYVHIQPSQLLLWITGSMVFLAVCGLCFIIMRFIERNVVLHEQASDELRAARRDSLTGVQGRAALEEELRRAATHAHESNAPLSIIVTDIDHFKRVNDEHGHGAGDDVLRSFAAQLRRSVRGSGGTVGRWGGEEFLIILPGLARPDAAALAEQLRRQINHSPLAGLEITASFSVASLRRDDEVNELFARADDRLYDAKDAGRNAVR